MILIHFWFILVHFGPFLVQVWCAMTCVRDEWWAQVGSSASPTSPANKRLCGGRPLLPPIVSSSSSSSSSTSTSLLSLHFFKVSLLFGDLFRLRTPDPVRFFEVTHEDSEGWSGRPWQGRGGGVAGRRGRASLSEVALAAAPTLAKLGLPSPGPAASHSASQHGWRAEQTRPVRAA